jgi:hypothetical protein
MTIDPDCICNGNWRLIVKENQENIGRFYRDLRTNKEYNFFGLVHSDDDFYYGLHGDGLKLVSCVMSLEHAGYELLPKPKIDYR